MRGALLMMFLQFFCVMRNRLSYVRENIVLLRLVPRDSLC